MIVVKAIDGLRKHFCQVLILTPSPAEPAVLVSPSSSLVMVAIPFWLALLPLALMYLAVASLAMLGTRVRSTAHQ